MFPLNYALAAVLLSTPAEPAEPPEAMDCLVTVRPAVRDLALSWEILDRARCATSSPGRKISRAT